MAKGAAKEEALGALHKQLAKVFGLTLRRYEAALSALDRDPEDRVDESLLAELAEITEPSPAMLSAIAKFLKDNEIGMDTEEVAKLNDTQRRLQERRKLRESKGVQLSVVPHVEAG